ncbi:MAG: hypothetical protein QOG50_3815 [Actinomycetota bacterium]|nr:hypothetical protein [Actinomycetota bacterium]
MSIDRRLSDAIADEMLDRLARSPELALVRHHVQITSFGGSGTTALYDHLLEAGVDVPATPGSFPFKHQRVPPAPGAVPAGFRVLYPFGDPRNAVVSVFRRGFQGGHYRGMRLRKPTPEVDDRLATLEQFLAAGVDDFEMEDHFDHWYASGARDYPVLFLRFEDLPATWPAVREFLGLRDDVECLPLRPRAIEWQDLPPIQRARVDEMYGPFARRLAALPSVEVR